MHKRFKLNTCFFFLINIRQNECVFWLFFCICFCLSVFKCGEMYVEGRIGERGEGTVSRRGEGGGEREIEMGRDGVTENGFFFLGD